MRGVLRLKVKVSKAIVHGLVMELIKCTLTQIKEMFFISINLFWRDIAHNVTYKRNNDITKAWL